MFCQELLCVLTSLSDLILIVSKPRTALLYNADIRCQIENIPDSGNTLAEHNIKFCFLKRRRNLILYNLDSCTVTEHFTTLL